MSKFGTGVLQARVSWRRQRDTGRQRVALLVTHTVPRMPLESIAHSPGNRSPTS
jgi:hypothetical protein